MRSEEQKNFVLLFYNIFYTFRSKVMRSEEQKNFVLLFYNILFLLLEKVK
jgi:hypothetical protein